MTGRFVVGDEQFGLWDLAFVRYVHIDQGKVLLLQQAGELLHVDVDITICILGKLIATHRVRLG